MALKDITGKDFKKSRSFRDISTNLVRNPFTSDVAVVNNADAIKQAVKNLILTAPGEKLFNPKFGSRVSQLLFEPLDPFLVDTLQTEILNTIKNNERRVVVTNLECTLNYDENSIEVTLEYQIIGLPITQTVQFVLERP
ncbi:base plate wedge subunit [Synechococcus phage S-H35]|uniref:Base plate wedge subunit n=1 Tax=Synechococcus phage S-H35 TaxID=1983572 RepID=A0A1Z1LW39_9CAUD|nr:baseplate wedge subunit [Synechococcus phage S-H35]ARW56883.1 base plate wedge subunit [Synechococcus phage S-H35]